MAIQYNFFSHNLHNNKVSVSFHRRYRFLFLPSNMATITSHANQQFTSKISNQSRCREFDYVSDEIDNDHKENSPMMSAVGFNGNVVCDR